MRIRTRGGSNLLVYIFQVAGGLHPLNLIAVSPVGCSVTENICYLLNFKLSPCSVCCMLSFG